MDLDQMKEVMEFMGALVVPLAGIAVGLYTWRKTGEVDLRKMWGHAKDVLHVVTEAIESGDSEDKAIDKGVEEIRKIRGKRKLSKKMVRKGRARLKSLVRDRVRGLIPKKD